MVNAVSTLTGMRLREAKDLVENAPGLVMRQVTSERADRAKELLERLGATVTVTSELSGITRPVLLPDPPWRVIRQRPPWP